MATAAALQRDANGARKGRGCWCGLPGTNASHAAPRRPAPPAAGAGGCSGTHKLARIRSLCPISNAATPPVPACGNFKAFSMAIEMKALVITHKEPWPVTEMLGSTSSHTWAIWEPDTQLHSEDFSSLQNIFPTDTSSMSDAWGLVMLYLGMKLLVKAPYHSVSGCTTGYCS